MRIDRARRRLPGSALTRAAVLTLALTVAVTGALTGCSSGSSSTQAASATGTPTATPTPTPTPTPTATPTPTLTPTPSPTASARPVLVLESDGLGVLTDATTGSIRQLAFGTATDQQVRQALTTTLGATATSGDQPECGQGARRFVQVGDVQALFDGTSFVGWYVGSKAPKTLTTADGLGLGVTLATVKAAQPDTQVTTDTLGPEFFSETGISGFLDGTKPTSTVKALYAGESCFFR